MEQLQTSAIFGNAPGKMEELRKRVSVCIAMVNQKDKASGSTISIITRAVQFGYQSIVLCS